MTELRIPIALCALTLVGTTSAIASAQAAHAPAPAPAPAPAQPVPLSDEAKVERVTGLFRAAKYQECVDGFEELLNPTSPGLSDRDLIETARIWDATCLLAIGEKKRADAVLRQVLEANPLMATPDNLTYPQSVIDEFLLVRGTMSREVEAADEKRRAEEKKRADADRARRVAEQERLRQLLNLAAREQVTVVNRRWIAAVPFGIGQFQNGQDTLGWLFLSSETVLGAAALTSVFVRTKLDADQARYQGDPVALSDVKNLETTWQTIGKISGWGFLGVAAIGIVHAELTFVPEFRTTKHRKLPPDLEKLHENMAIRVRPEIEAVPGGVGLGIRGAF